MSPYDPFLDQKFYSGPQTLAVDPEGFILSCHKQRNIINFWSWEKREVVLRSPTKERVAILKLTGAFCVAGTKIVEGSGFGKVFVWRVSDG